MDDTTWEYYLERYLNGSLSTAEADVFEQTLEDSPEREAEVELRQLERRAIDRFYAYTKDKPEAFPESFPGTKLYFASLFSSALFLGTYSARLYPKEHGAEQDSDQQAPPDSGAVE